MTTIFPAVCPHCGVTNQGHAPVDGVSSPDSGDVSICWSCHGLAIFTDDLHLRRPTDAEEAEFRTDPEVATALRTLQRRMS